MTRRIPGAAVVVALVVIAGVVQWQSPAAVAAEWRAAQTVADARAAASAIENDPTPDPTPSGEPTVAPTPEPTPPAAAVPLGTITPNRASTVEAPEVGAVVEFSGHDVAESLDVAVTVLPESAATSAES